MVNFLKEAIEHTHTQKNPPKTKKQKCNIKMHLENKKNEIKNRKNSEIDNRAKTEKS